MSDAGLKLNKNQIIELTIDDLNDRGQGVGRYGTIAVFVPYALPGEKVTARVIKVKKTYAIAKLLEINVQSKDRLSCNFTNCGGCRLQHLEYEAALRYKRDKVINCLRTIAKADKDLLEQITAPTLSDKKAIWHYRGKVVYAFQYRNSKLELGHYAEHSHVVVDRGVCIAEPLYAYDLRVALKKCINDFVQERAQDEADAAALYARLIYDEASNRGLLKRLMLRFGFAADKYIATLVLNCEQAEWRKDKLCRDLCAALEACMRNCRPETVAADSTKTEAHAFARNFVLHDCVYNFQPYATNTIFGNNWSQDPAAVTIEERLQVGAHTLRYTIGPGDFFQINPLQTNVLFTYLLDALELKGDEIVYDLYCGAGSISLPLAKAAQRVVGIELVESAVKHAEANAALNDVANVTFYAGDCGALFPKLFADGVRADVVVVDPPRKGLDAATIATVKAMSAKKIAYVSCHPGSLARDVALLTADGRYELKSVQPVDLFPWTTHVECVCLMTRVR